MEKVMRNFRVQGQISTLYTPPGGAPIGKDIPNLKVELWHKGPMEAVFLGRAPVADDGTFVVDFSSQSPNEMIIEGQIEDVFLKLFYRDEIIAGE